MLNVVSWRTRCFQAVRRTTPATRPLALRPASRGHPLQASSGPEGEEAVAASARSPRDRASIGEVDEDYVRRRTALSMRAGHQIPGRGCRP